MKNLYILIVEDEPVWQRNLTRVLNPIGPVIVNAFDYPDALNQIERLGSAIILAIVDLSLPASGTEEDSHGNAYGLKVLDALRAKGVYAIVMSGYAYHHAQSLAVRPEVCEVVDKLRFADEQFEQIFVDKVAHVMLQAEAAYRAEGKLPQQRERLRNLDRW